MGRSGKGGWMSGRRLAVSEGYIPPPTSPYLKGRRERIDIGRVLLIGMVVVFTAAWVVPVGAIWSRVLSVRSFVDVIRSPHFGKVIGFTVGQALLCTAICVVLGGWLGMIVGRYDFRGKAIYQTLLMVPFVLPTVVVALLARMIFGDATVGVSWWPIVAAHVFYNVSIVIRLTAPFWANLDEAYLDAARVAGANPLTFFGRLVWPLLLPALGAAALLVFVYCCTSFGVVLLLGGIKFSSIEVEIYRQTFNYLRLDQAAALSLLQLLVLGAFAVLYGWLTRHVVATAVTHVKRQLSVVAALHKWLYRLSLLVSFGAVLLPLLVLLFRSLLVGKQVSLHYYIALFSSSSANLLVSPLAALENSLLVAMGTVGIVAAAGLVLIFVLVERRRQSGLVRLLPYLLLAPLGISAVTLGLGMLVSPLFRSLLGTKALLVLVHSLLSMGIVLGSLLPAMSKLAPQLGEVAATLGAGPVWIFGKIWLPLMKRVLLSALIFASLISLGEFGATVMLTRAENTTMPLLMSQFLGRPGSLNFGRALAMGSLLMVLCLIGVGLMQWLQNKEF